MARVPLIPLLQGTLAYALDRLFEQHAPQTIEVPSGSQIKLDYSGPKPVLAARLQELFGWTDTLGRIAARARPSCSRICSASTIRAGADHRRLPAVSGQATYFQVRKDLRTRYPKHSWPEDPLTAKPEAKGRRRS